MKFSVKRTLIALLIATMFLYGCQSNNKIGEDTIGNSSNNAENDFDTFMESNEIETSEPIPDIQSFSGERYEDYEWQFSDIKSAYYVSNGNRLEIDKDDPRVIRLLNFIAKSHNDLTEIYETQGIDTEQIQTLWLDDPSPMLEINFAGSDDNNDNLLRRTFQLLIRGSGVIYICHNGLTELYGESGIYGEQRWPYFDCVRNQFECQNDKKAWLNLLEIAGF